ncbi:MerR family DNA-binding protein [Streptomyces filamentosus]|uniref:Heavy metal-responsive transcriptional regulator n=1 Tax=Streptomyces filamentosus TaxID=67294 RepID=A0A919ES09_STRFL|nr:MerR family DNA-binding protein [Streptomyces filamentosus]GHG12446.1 heavy metal-responsive transcriptional regulator [Streptomyces filamentosus]GHG22406.1 heavy metal-responsive transcriptional regulator [Streptomyces filamentosus]
MRIGALATATGTTTKTLRFYEQAGLLTDPPRTPGGYRDYPAHTTARVDFIRSAQAAGLSLAEIRDVLAIRDGGQPPCTHVTTLLGRHLADVERRIAELETTRAMLRELTRTASTIAPETCTEGDICRILAAD